MKLLVALASAALVSCTTVPVAKFDGATYQWWRDHDKKLLQDGFTLMANGRWCLDDICDDVARYCSSESAFACVATPMLDFAVPRKLDKLAWEFKGKYFCMQRTAIFAIPGGWVEGTESNLRTIDVGGRAVDAAIVHEISQEGDVKTSFFYSPKEGLIQYLDWANYPEPTAVTVSLAGQCGVGCSDLEQRYAPTALLDADSEPSEIRMGLVGVCAAEAITE